MARPFLVPFRRLLRLAGSRWRYSTPPPHGLPCSLSIYRSENVSRTKVVENNDTHTLFECSFSLIDSVLQKVEKLCGHTTINIVPPNTRDYRKINNDFRNTGEGYGSPSSSIPSS
jgi:hypothetical protein